MKVHIVKRTIIFISVLAVLSACAAVWGKSYQIKEQNENGITIQYDTTLNSSAMMQKMATNHCKKFKKKAVIQNAHMPGLLLGIIEEKYSCEEK